MMSILRSTTSHGLSEDKSSHQSLGDRLPQNRDVEDVRQNFKGTVEAIAVVVRCHICLWRQPLLILCCQTSLFAGIQAQLLSGTPSEPSSSASQGIIRALQLVSYGGLAVNVGAALSALLFLDIVGEAPERFRRWKRKAQSSPQAARAASLADANRTSAGLELLLAYGVPRSLQLAWYHCVVSTVFGTLSVLLQISFLAWINLSPQDSGVAVAVLLALFWAGLPLPGFLLFNFFKGCCAGVRDGLGQ
ncbi:hypothetical protein C8R46DRAFT_318713 [Mycena filopes]|nr:hypothetical protein C8R46DRAFT_318713 [Mycena filopes]